MNSLDSLTAATSPYNDLLIPQVMSSVYLITKGTAIGLFVLFFLAEALRLQVQAMQYAAGGTSSKPALNKFLIRSFILFLSLTCLYNGVFIKIVSICDSIALAIADDSKWANFIGVVSQDGSTAVPWYHLNVSVFIGALALVALQYVQDVFTLMRFVLLCLLYCVGPIAWACSISELGIGVLRGWFKNTIQVSFWLVMFAIMKVAILPLFVNAFAGGLVDGSIVGIVFAIVVVMCVFMIPTLTGAVMSEGNLGAVAGAAMSIATYGSIRAAAAHGDSAHKGLFGGGKGNRHESVADAVRAFRGGQASAKAGGGGTLAGLAAGLGAVSNGVLGETATGYVGAAASKVGQGISKAGSGITSGLKFAKDFFQAPRMR